MAHELLAEEEQVLTAEYARSLDLAAHLRLVRVQQVGTDVHAALTMVSNIARKFTATAPEPSLPAKEPKRVVSLLLHLERPHEVRYHGLIVSVRPAEFRLLAALAQKPGKCLSWEALYEEMWGDGPLAEPGQMYSHASRLRKKLTEAAPHVDADKVLVTIPRRGLMLDLPASEVVLQ
jgi:DNA-binding response OmpR family regulator